MKEAVGSGLSFEGGPDDVLIPAAVAAPPETATTIGALIGGSANATPNDTDFVATSLTAGGILKKITWTNVKAFLKTYFDTLYPSETATTIGALIGGSADATPNDTDFVATSLTAAGILKKITWTNVKAFLKTYLDTLYQAILVSGTNIKTVNGSSLLGSGDFPITGTNNYIFSTLVEVTKAQLLNNHITAVTLIADVGVGKAILLHRISALPAAVFNYTNDATITDQTDYMSLPVDVSGLEPGEINYIDYGKSLGSTTNVYYTSIKLFNFFSAITDVAGNSGSLWFLIDYSIINTTTHVFVNNQGSPTPIAWGDITGTMAVQTDLQNALDAKTTLTAVKADVDVASAISLKHATGSDAETATTIGALIGGSADATPNDTDFVATSLTTGGILKKITWTNVKAFLKTYFDTLYPSETATTIGALIGGSADATPNDTDFVATSLTTGGILKKITWTNVKAFLKTYFDTLYSLVGHTHAGYGDASTNTALSVDNEIAVFSSITGKLLKRWNGTGVLRTDAGVASIDTDVTDIVAAASESAAGKVELATVTEVTAGTDATRAICPDQLAGSTIFGRKTATLIVVERATNLAIGDGQIDMTVPEAMNGMNLVRVHARVITAGTTGTTDIQIANVTDAVDMLSTKLTIDSGETGSDTAATPAVINSTYDDVATNDWLRIDIDAISTTAPKGLIITLEFQLP